MSTTEKKQQLTSKSMESHSSRRKKPSVTLMPLKIMTKITAQSKKKDGKQLADVKTDLFLSLQQKELVNASELSAHEALQHLKKKSMEDKQSGGDGWVRRNPQEHAGMLEIVDGLKAARRKVMGRPPKAPEDVGKVRSLRLSDAMISDFEAKAQKAGFNSWQEWAKELLVRA